MPDLCEIDLHWMHEAEELSRSLAALPGSSSLPDWDQTIHKCKEQLKRQYDVDQLILIARVTEITRTISSSLDLSTILPTVVRLAAELIDADAGAIALLAPGAGVHYPYLYNLPESLSRQPGSAGKGLDWEVIQTRLPRLVAEYASSPGALPEWLAAGVQAVVSVPILTGQECTGALNLFKLTPGKTFTERDLCLAESVGRQAAITMENAVLFDSLQRAHAELALSYDATLEGWARALELRDRETEGHSQRVIEMTLELAQEVGIRQPEALIQLRRGALLHDIGKMAIPDSILLKPGPLTEEEWQIMRKHPVYAYELLRPIPNLRQCLNIPYCHHEKWDGTGYPRGLKGEAIPLEARLFAVVDVWEALCSDRPYRKAWPLSKTTAHLHAEAGLHFDPEIVQSFLKLIA
jgi:HD-GYP domain-containing protein (c-di-GMP phosphodiesterase class II)